MQPPTASEFHVYNCEMDLGLMYAQKFPVLAADCFQRCVLAAERMGREDLAAKAHNMIAQLDA